RVEAEAAVSHVDNEAERELRGIGRPSKAEPFRSFVVEQLAKQPELMSLEVLRRARLQGYSGGKSALYALVHAIRPKRMRLITRFEGLPGEFSQHARSRIGGVVTATYFPKTGLVDVAVADIGCGIRATLHERYQEIRDDYKAVKFAIQPHVSGTFQRGAYESMANNAGLGLFFIKEIATLSGGGFFLASGSMLADLWGNLDGSPGKRYFLAKAGGWRGTFALLQLRRDRI
ncbi:MAG: hypothetical protein DMF81_25615, partial [Acidobacteria bacterium]